MATTLPRIFVCSDPIDMVDYIDIGYASLNLVNIPSITANTSVDVNVFVSNKTASSARINFSQKFVGTVYYTVVGFR